MAQDTQRLFRLTRADEPGAEIIGTMAPTESRDGYVLIVETPGGLRVEFNDHGKGMTVADVHAQADWFKGTVTQNGWHDADAN